jgi:hypothetical protein
MISRELDGMVGERSFEAAMKFMKPFNPAVFVAGVLVMTAFAGCWKKSGEAMVVEKEYIAAGEQQETPTPANSPPEPGATPVNPAASPSEPGESEEYAAKPLAEDEIVVESYVMKKNVRGTSKDPRAYPGLEQWRIGIRMVEGGRGFMVQAKQAQYEKLKVGDRVKVRYREGKYSGTVWSAEIVD